MDEVIFNLFKFMKENFGDLGYSILSREMKNINHDSNYSLSDTEKNILVERIIDSFSDYSASKRGVIRSQLMSMMKYSQDRIKTVNNESAIEFLMGNSN